MFTFSFRQISFIHLNLPSLSQKEPIVHLLDLFLTENSLLKMKLLIVFLINRSLHIFELSIKNDINLVLRIMMDFFNFEGKSFFILNFLIIL